MLILVILQQLKGLLSYFMTGLAPAIEASKWCKESIILQKKPILHVFEVTTIGQAMNFWNKLVYWFFRELVLFIKTRTFEDHFFRTWK